VLAIIVLLVALLVPSFNQARESAWQAKCASNLHQLRIAITGNRLVDGIDMPTAAHWIEFVSSKDAAEALVCPKDEAPEGAAAMLEGIYIFQHANWKHRPNQTNYSYTPLTALLKGASIPDPQIKTWYRGNEPYGTRDWWYQGSDGTAPLKYLGYDAPEGPTDNTLVVGIDNDGGIAFHFDAAQPYVEALPGWGHGASRHFLCIAPSDDDIGNVVDPNDPGWAAQELLHLPGAEVGRYYIDPRSPLRLIGGSSSFGMNNQINPKRLHDRQVLLLDYEKTVVDLDGHGVSDDDFVQEFAGRHFDKANVLYVDGSVELTSRAALEPTDSTPWHGRN